MWPPKAVRNVFSCDTITPSNMEGCVIMVCPFTIADNDPKPCRSDCAWLQNGKCAIWQIVGAIDGLRDAVESK